tara:strand:+ start:656 stop:823 length:168 start_codon:yes stop_codon:yes gene_type:complete
MKKIIVIISVLLITSCGMFNKITKSEQELNYKLNKLWLDYTYERDSLIIEYYKEK